MKISISNIGWEAKNDHAVYEMMKKYGFQGLEIAPTRIFSETPYEKSAEAGAWSEKLKRDYGFIVSSMQSIWYGREERLFGSQEERQVLFEYTKKAINFAEMIHCKNLVFGCPRNRMVSDDADITVAIDFFRELGGCATSKGTVISMEANPPVYNTNYINNTISALELIKKVDSDGFKLNLDLGTMVYNEEGVSELIGNVHLINHVHISEPGLQPIEKRTLHVELKEVLEDEGYDGFISIEMGKTENISILEEKMRYVRGVFVDS